ncbi:39S ribosomal protein L44, mitochondrial [Xanthoria calcicola]
MLTKFITEVTTTFNPFRRPGRTCRVFLAHLPANARSTMRITTNILPRDSQDRSLLKLKFKDGMEMQLDAEKMSIKDLMEEVDRHSRLLRRQADLAGS